MRLDRSARSLTEVLHCRWLQVCGLQGVVHAPACAAPCRVRQFWRARTQGVAMHRRNLKVLLYTGAVAASLALAGCEGWNNNGGNDKNAQHPMESGNNPSA